MIEISIFDRKSNLLYACVFTDHRGKNTYALRRSPRYLRLYVNVRERNRPTTVIAQI